MLSLSIVAACIIGCNYAVENCPSGTSQVGRLRSSVSGTCQVYPSIPDIATCRASCTESECNGRPCAAFGYSALQDRCVTYQRANTGKGRTRTEKRRPRAPPDQILCAVTTGQQQCPSGFTEIGGRTRGHRGGDRGGRYGGHRGRRLQSVVIIDDDTRNITNGANECGQETADSIGECGDYCNAYADNCCQSFAYSAVTLTCAIYADTSPRPGKRIGPNQILCAVTADLPAQSPGLFSVDGMVGYSNGNGQVYVQIPAYVVYGIVALILVNIVCLMVHFWNKSKGNNNDYKTVSMRSDIEEETDLFIKKSFF